MTTVISSGKLVFDNGVVADYDTVSGAFAVSDDEGNVFGRQLIQQVTHDGTRFLAVAQGGVLATSTDGSAWTRINTPRGYFFRSVFSKGGNWYIGASDTGADLTAVILRSSNQGATWTVQSLPAQSGYTTKNTVEDFATDGGNYIVAVGQKDPYVSTSSTANTHVWVSVDNGSTWQLGLHVVKGSGGTRAQVLWDGTRFVIPMYLDRDIVTYIPGGSFVINIDWLPASALSNMIWDGTYFVFASGTSPSLLRYSTNAQTWSSYTPTYVDAGDRALAFIHKRTEGYVCVTTGGDVYHVATLGTAWSRVGSHPVGVGIGAVGGGIMVLPHVTAIDSMYIVSSIGDERGALRSSSDYGVTLTQRTYGEAFVSPVEFDGGWAFFKADPSKTLFLNSAVSHHGATSITIPDPPNIGGRLSRGYGRLAVLGGYLYAFPSQTVEWSGSIRTAFIARTPSLTSPAWEFSPLMLGGMNSFTHPRQSNGLLTNAAGDYFFIDTFAMYGVGSATECVGSLGTCFTSIGDAHSVVRSMFEDGFFSSASAVHTNIANAYYFLTTVIHGGVFYAFCTTRVLFQSTDGITWTQTEHTEIPSTQNFSYVLFSSSVGLLLVASELNYKASVYKFNVATQTFDLFISDISRPFNYYQAISEHGGHLFIGNLDGGVVVYTTSGALVSTFSKSVSALKVHSIAAVHNNVIVTVGHTTDSYRSINLTVAKWDGSAYIETPTTGMTTGSAYALFEYDDEIYAVYRSSSDYSLVKLNTTTDVWDAVLSIGNSVVDPLCHYDSSTSRIYFVIPDKNLTYPPTADDCYIDLATLEITPWKKLYPMTSMSRVSSSSSPGARVMNSVIEPPSVLSDVIFGNWSDTSASVSPKTYLPSGFSTGTTFVANSPHNASEIFKSGDSWFGAGNASTDYYQSDDLRTWIEPEVVFATGIQDSKSVYRGESENYFTWRNSVTLNDTTGLAKQAGEGFEIIPLTELRQSPPNFLNYSRDSVRALFVGGERDWAVCNGGIIRINPNDAEDRVFTEYNVPLGRVSALFITEDEVTIVGEPALLDDSIRMACVLRGTPISRVAERLLISETVTPTATIRALVNDQLGYGEALAAIVLALSQDGLTLTDASNGALQRLALMAELLACASGSTASVEIAASLMDLLAAREALSYVQGATMDETLALADNLTAAVNALAHSADFLALTESYQSGLIALVGDSVAVEDMTSPQVEMLLSWQDAILCFTNLSLDDGNYTAWVMNAETTGMSRYTVPALNSLFDHDGRIWGVSETGLWELAGDTDDGEPIEAWVKTGHMDFGTGHAKNIPRAYLYVKTTGEMALKTVSSDRGTRTERTYAVHTDPSGDDAAGRIVRLARGLRGVYWQIEIGNTDGCDFDIENCEVHPVVLSRRGQ